MSAPPRLEEHFARWSLLGYARRRHPYDFIETYEALRDIYGYTAHYVNLGWWGTEHEPGRALAFALADAIGVQRGDRLIDAGSGLGQAAVDLCERHELAEVLGINPNRRQLGFANALARSRGLGERIGHREGDAGVFLGSLSPGSYDRVLAIECISYFSDRMRFFRDAHRALAPGGSLGFCCNVAAAPLTPIERAVVALTWGFVPRSAKDWTESVRAAGFDKVRCRDITERVLRPMTEACLARLEAGAGRALSPIVRAMARRGLRSARRHVEAGRLGYALVTATRA